jgi:cell division protein FtsQ
MDEVTEAAEPRSKRSALLMVLLAVTLLGVAIFANVWKSDLTVASVTVAGNSIVAEKEILVLAGISETTKLFEVDLFAVRKRIEQNHFIRSASVNREVPNRITIGIEERVPIAAVVLDKVFYLDAEGYVLPPVRSENIFDLPVLTGTLQRGELTPGKQCVTASVRDALDILTVAQKVSDESYRRISEVHIEGGKDIIVYAAEFGVPIIFGRGDTAAKLLKLDSFWREFVNYRGAQELQYVDLRFQDQVVVRWSHGKEEMRNTPSKQTGLILMMGNR